MKNDLCAMFMLIAAFVPGADLRAKRMSPSARRLPRLKGCTTVLGQRRSASRSRILSHIG